MSTPEPDATPPIPQPEPARLHIRAELPPGARLEVTVRLETSPGGEGMERKLEFTIPTHPIPLPWWRRMEQFTPCLPQGKRWRTGCAPGLSGQLPACLPTLPRG